MGALLRYVPLILGLTWWAQVIGQSFNDRYDHLGYQWPEAAWSIEKTDGGYLIFEGFGVTESTEAQVGLVSRDNSGNFSVTGFFTADSINFTCGWANTTDSYVGGGHVMCGTTDAQGVAHALVWRFDDNGDTLWTTQLFNDSGYTSLGWMAKGLNNGSVVATGRVFLGTGSAQAFLCKLNAFGDTIWSRDYGGSAFDAAYSVDLTADGGFVLGGYTTSYDGGDQQTYVVRTDSMGNQLWYETLGSNEEDCIGDVTVAMNSDIVVTGCRTQYFDGNNYHLRAYAARLTDAGSVLWEKQYGPVDPWSSISTARELPDGSFISPGTWLAGPGSGPKGVLLKFNAEGDSIWMRQYDHPSATGWLRWHVLKDLVLEPDGGVTACGYLSDTANQDLWVIRVDSCGCLVPGCQQFDNIAEQGLDLNILAYPNPTSGKFYLSFRSARAPNGEFVLFNSSGAAVQRFQPGSKSVEVDLDISEQPVGLYLIKYSDQNGTRWESRIIKE